MLWCESIYFLVPNVYFSPAGDNGSFAIYTFFGQMRGPLRPPSLFTMLVAPQPATRVAMGPEAVRVFVCLIMAKEAVALHRLRPGPSGFAILGIADP